MKDASDTIRAIQSGLEPYIKPREQVNYIRRILALQLGSYTNDKKLPQPLALSKPPHDFSSAFSEAKGVHKEYLQALKDNEAARRGFEDVLLIKSKQGRSVSPTAGTGEEFLEEQLAILKLRRKREKFLAIQQCIDDLFEKPAALPSYLDARIMTLYNYLVGASIAAVARAAQPGAVAPVKAPMRNLTWGQLNFIHTTDTHGWLGGHFQEPQYSGDWGDFISFSHHMSAKADEKGADLLFVDTGDRIEGNGLYDASSPKGFYQYDIYAEHDVDIMSTGNHELYQVYSADLEHNTTTRNYPNNYIASNLDYIDLSTGDQSPMAPRFRKFTTKNQKIEVLAMGFIFDFTGNNKNTAIQPVRQTIKEEWFQKAIRERPDIFVIAGHVGLRMEEFGIIFTELRKADWDTPVVFFGGHAHVRDARKYDSLSIGMASGRYMESIGWMSVDGLNKKNKGEVSTQKSVSFHRKYIDNNLYGMYHHTGLNESTFPTAHGQNVSSMIDSARQALKLDHKYGCAPKNYWMSRAKHGSEDNLYTFIENEVFPGVVVNEERKDKPRLTIMNTGGIRFDIFKGPFTRDTTYIVSPFVSGFRYVPDVPYKIANNVIKLLNSGGRILDMVPENRFMAIPEQMFPSPLVSFTEDVQDVNLELRGEQKPLNGLDDETPLIGGLTTSDDIGDDGDDTIHEKLPFHPQPNAFQAKIAFPPDNKDPETVDLVFIDFVQPWIIPALKLSGGDYDDKDVEIYMEGTFTSKLSQWISDNWKGEC